MTEEEMRKEQEVLEERTVRAEQFARECQAEAAVYREMLEECYKAAQEASDTKNVRLLHTVTGRHTFNVFSEREMKQLGKDFLHAYIRDASWLSRTKEALEKIKAEVQRLEVEKGSPNAELKERIIELADYGLTVHL